MIERWTFIRLSVICLLSWAFLVGLTVELQEESNQEVGQVVIFGVVDRVLYDEMAGAGEMTILCGGDEVTVRIEQLSTIPQPGSAILIQCEFLEGGLPLLKQVID